MVFGLLGLLCSLPAHSNARGDAARFLIQASFGPTPEAISDVVDDGYAAWIDDQMAIAPSHHLPLTMASLEPEKRPARMKAWFEHAIHAPDQLRQRVAFALSQILVVSDQATGMHKRGRGLAYYYDHLVDHAFGDFRALLEAVTLNPVMGKYLSMLNNRAPDPAAGRRADENYARELMQLFTIGTVKLNLDGSPVLDENDAPVATYTQDDIVNLARVLTGWVLGKNELNQDSWMVPMRERANWHDTDEKTIIGGVVIPAGLSAQEELTIALDTLFAHPNVGPFISYRLIQRLTTANPSPGYVERVARVFNNNGDGVRGDLGAVVRAILLDDEARAAQPLAPVGKPREPLLLLTHLWRAYDGRALAGFNFNHPEKVYGQAALAAPTVFNFYSPDYAPAGEITEAGLVAPEFELANETSRTAILNDLYVRTYNRHRFTALPTDHDDVTIDITPAAELATTDIDGLIDHLDELLMAGQMPAELRETLAAHLPTVKLRTSRLQSGRLIVLPAQAGADRALDGIYLTISSPYFAVQH